MPLAQNLPQTLPTKLLTICSERARFSGQATSFSRSMDKKHSFLKNSGFGGEVRVFSCKNEVNEGGEGRTEVLMRDNPPLSSGPRYKLVSNYIYIMIALNTAVHVGTNM